MLKFKITESRVVTKHWDFYVEAETESQALEMIIAGEVTPDDYYEDTGDWDSNETMYNVEIIN